MVIATTAATAGISSASTDGGIINTLLKVAFIIAILGILILGLMWISGTFSLSDIIADLTAEFKDFYVKTFKESIMRYTPLGWAISAGSGVLSLIVGRAKGFDPFKWW